MSKNDELHQAADLRSTMNLKQIKYKEKYTWTDHSKTVELAT
jgi:hypothetical protein